MDLGDSESSFLRLGRVITLIIDHYKDLDPFLIEFVHRDISLN